MITNFFRIGGKIEGRTQKTMISVIVPIYNVAAYLEACIESICNQTYKDIEIILVDDGSTDGCYEICERYRGRDSRIRVIHKENGGLVSARKAGMRIARGQYIAFVDGDDWIEPDMYERMYRTMSEQDVDIVMCGHYENTGTVRKEVYHGIQEKKYGKEELLREIYPYMVVDERFFDCPISLFIWDKLFRRECLEKNLLSVDERITMGEDAACVFPCLLQADSIYVTHECFYHYRQTTSSMIKSVPDPCLEQTRFQVLYQTVTKKLSEQAGIFDLREQWKKFMLFLMVPRADSLYKGYGELEYLFPFPQVKKGSRIILYGAGTYGQRLYAYLKRSGFCQVVSWVDRNYLQLQEMGLSVEAPTVLPQKEYDAIVIANMFWKSRESLYQELCSKYPGREVYMIDEELIFSYETIQAFGLVE